MEFITFSLNNNYIELHNNYKKLTAVSDVYVLVFPWGEMELLLFLSSSPCGGELLLH